MCTRSVKLLTSAAVFAGVLAFSGSPILAQDVPPWSSASTPDYESVGIFEIGDQTVLFGTGIAGNEDDDPTSLAAGGTGDGKANIVGSSPAGPDWSDLFIVTRECAIDTSQLCTEDADCPGAGDSCTGDQVSVQIDEIAVHAYDGLGASFTADDLAQGSAVDRTVFVSSNKNNDPISSWQWNTGNTPGKDDLSNVYAYGRVNDKGERVLFVGIERLAPNGDSHVDTEINQQQVGLENWVLDADGRMVCSAPDGAKNCGFSGAKQQNDILFNMDFERGGGVGVIELLLYNETLGEYVIRADLAGEGCNPPINLDVCSDSGLVCSTDADCTGGSDLCSDTLIIPEAVLCGFNSGPGNINGGPWDNFDSHGKLIADSDGLQPNAFTEVALNTTKLFAAIGDPEPLCFATFNAKTRTSASINSELKDFALGAFELCDTGGDTAIYDNTPTGGEVIANQIGVGGGIDVTSGSVLEGSPIVENARVTVSGPGQLGDLPDPGEEVASFVQFTVFTGLQCGCDDAAENGSASYPCDTPNTGTTVDIQLDIGTDTADQASIAMLDLGLASNDISFLAKYLGETFVFNNVQTTYPPTDLEDSSNMGQSPPDLCESIAVIPLGQIVIQKQTLPDGDDESFDFAFTGPDSYSDPFQLSDDQKIETGFALAPGLYAVQESVPAGWDLTGLSCVDPSGGSSTDLGTATATIDLAAGETVTCTYVNTKRGSITIEKQTLPADDPATFAFTGDVAATLSDNQTKSVSVAPGTYSSTESIPDGWDLTDVTCDDQNSGGDIGTATATFIVEPGESVTCTFTNTKWGSIAIEKQTMPDGDLATFNFTGDVAANLSDNQSISVPVAPGTYSSTETVPNGWNLTDVSCDDANSSGDTGTATATFIVEPGEPVICTFTNTKRASITIEKQTQPAGDPTTFNFSGDVAGSLSDGGTATVSVAPGLYTSTEEALASWNLTDISCDNANGSGNTTTRTATFDVAAGEEVTCTFTNTQQGTIIIEKQTQPHGDPATFDFSGDVSGTLGDDQTASMTVSPGQYSSTESVPAGWDLTDITCNDGDSGGDVGTGIATFNVTAGETVTCTFTNTKRGTVVINKVTVGGDGTFTYGGDLDGFSGSLTTSGGNASETVASVLPGSYQVIESDPGPDFELTAVSCTDASGTDIDSFGSLVERKATLVVDPGETVTCTFINSRQTLNVTKLVTSCRTDDSGRFALLIDDTACTDNPVEAGGSCTTPVPVSIGSHKADELVTVNAASDYERVISGDCAPDGLVEVTAGSAESCTITNIRKPRLTVIKHVSPSGAGTFNLLFDGALVEAGVGDGGGYSKLIGNGDFSAVLDADSGSFGTIVVSETMPNGSAVTNNVFIICDMPGNLPSITSNTPSIEVPLNAGDHVTCEIFNNIPQANVECLQ